MIVYVRHWIGVMAWGLGLLLTVGADASEDREAASPIRVLLLSGASNHDWKSTTPEVERILEGTGRFDVDVLEKTHTMTAARLSDYDVIVSDFNTFTARYKDERDPGWSEETQRAYIDFVRRGGGHVAVHAGSSSFYDWPDYQELVITSFRVGQTDHGARHDFPVRLDVPDHAITRGLSAFTTFDELWHEAPVPDDATVLASAFSSKESRGSGHYEPVAMVRPFGKGRCFTLLLGHDARAMENSAFGGLLARGTEWAATGDVTIPVPEDWPGIEEQELPTNVDPLRWRRDEETLALLDGERIIWQFNHGKKAGKPHFHPLAFRAGVPLTAAGPIDHPWHYGLWFSWKYINGVNYWEENRVTGKAEGTTNWTVTRMITEENHTAHIEMDLRYHVGDAAPVLTERRIIDVSAPDEDGTYFIDWTIITKAGPEKVILDRTPLPGEPGGKVFGGYAGLSVRFASKFDDRQVVSSEGEVTFEDDRHRSRAAAMDYTGLINDERAGMAIITHRGMLISPSPWYVIKGPVMSFFSPAVLCYGPVWLSADSHFTLCYRVIVHGGAWNAERLNEEEVRYNEQKED